jgi:hypothetical protein
MNECRAVFEFGTPNINVWRIALLTGLHDSMNVQTGGAKRAISFHGDFDCIFNTVESSNASSIFLTYSCLPIINCATMKAMQAERERDESNFSEGNAQFVEFML